MKCQECGADRPLTYRSTTLGLRSVCAPCIRKNHPETIRLGNRKWRERDERE